MIISLLVGGLLGWAAGMFMSTDERRRIVLNVFVGIFGVVLGGWLLSGLVGSSPFDRGEFSIVGLLVSVLGTMVLLVAVQLFGGITGRQVRTAPKRDLIAYSRFLYRDPLTK